MNKLTEMIVKIIDEISIDDVLRCLIFEESIEEVVFKLDTIARENGQSIEMYYDTHSKKIERM